MTKVNQAEFAKMHGVSRKTVTMWKSRGWLVMNGNDVDVDASNKNIHKYRKTVTSSKKAEGESNKVTVSKETPAQVAERIVLELGADMDMDEARRVKENYFALIAKIEYEEKAGLLLPWKEMSKAVVADYSRVRTRLMAIAPEHGPRLKLLATTATNEEFVAALQEVVHEAMEELSSDQRGEGVH